MVMYDNDLQTKKRKLKARMKLNRNVYMYNKVLIILVILFPRAFDPLSF